MTRIMKARFRRLFVILAITSGVVALAIGTTSAAKAGETPSPSPSDTPTVSPDFGYHPTPTPTPTPRVRLRDWDFDLQLSDIAGLAVNDVEGRGAILANRWRDITLSPNVDRFQLGGNSVTLLHDALPVPDVNLNTCTITFSQPDGRFRILAGTGTAAGLRSLDGQFDLQGLISVQRIHRHLRYGHDDGLSVCPLSFLTPGQILRAVLYNRSLGAPVVFSDFSVQGHARVFRAPVRIPVPYPTHTIYPAPTV